MKKVGDNILKPFFNLWFLLFFFFIIYTLTIFVPRPTGLSITNGDEPHYLIMSYSMLYDQDLDIENNYKNYSYHTWYPAPYLVGHMFEFNNKNYPLHQPGLSAYILPAFAVGERNAAAIFLAFLTSLSVLNIYKILQYFVSKKTALFTSLVTGLSVPVFVYSILIYPEVVILFLMSAILRIVLDPKFKLTFKNGLLLVLLTALIPPLHIKFGLLIGLILLYINIIQFKKVKLPNLVIFNFLVTVGSSLYLYWMYNFFGGYFFEVMNHIAAGNKFLLEYVPSGLLGSLVDRENGLLIFAPIFIYIFIGFGYFFKNFKLLNFHEKVTRLFIFTLIIVQTLFVTMYPHILGGQNPSGRYFLPIFPALVIILAFAFENVQKYKIQRIIMGILLVYTLIVTVILAFNPVFALPFGGGNNMVTFLLKENSVIVHKALPNLSKFDRQITTYDYQKGVSIFLVYLLLSYSHLLRPQLAEEKIIKKRSKKKL